MAINYEKKLNLKFIVIIQGSTSYILIEKGSMY
jgi:hypothetical protein